MYKSKFPLPRKYWIYVSLCAICTILLFVNLHITGDWTGEKEFYEFNRQDWNYFFLFVLMEVVTAFFLFLFTVLASRIGIKRRKQLALYWEQMKFSGIKPGDYDYIWFDPQTTYRALILKQKNMFLLQVEKFHIQTDSWHFLSNSTHASMEEISYILVENYGFYNID